VVLLALGLSVLRCVFGRGGFRADPLLLVVLERRLDGVLREDGAVDLHRGQLELVHDVRVLDLGRIVHGLALEPLRGQARRGDGAAAPERLELRVLDHAGLDVHLDLQLHDVAALGCADQPRAHTRRVLGEGSAGARVAVVIDHLVAVCHGYPASAPRGRRYSAFQLIDRRSTPSFASSYSGDISRSRSTTSTVRLPTNSTSSSVL